MTKKHITSKVGLPRLHKMLKDQMHLQQRFLMQSGLQFHCC